MKDNSIPDHLIIPFVKHLNEKNILRIGFQGECDNCASSLTEFSTTELKQNLLVKECINFGKELEFEKDKIHIALYFDLTKFSDLKKKAYPWQKD